jgi:hypothetical protein
MKKAHVIFKTHLDLGFTDMTANVVKKYFDEFIPSAVALARKVNTGQDKKFVWTVGSWLIWHYLKQTDSQKVKDMEEAIDRGDIAWHALPFTMHTELLDAETLRYGLSLSQRLDRRFGKTTIAAKTTDVPGMTKAMLPYLWEAGVKFLHKGVNTVCRLPEVPEAFRWEFDKASIVTVYDKAYGSAYVNPEIADVLAFVHTNDNVGPIDKAMLEKSLWQLKEAYPDARTQASTLNDYAEKLLKVADRLPVVTSEIGDTWIHGAGTDPYKTNALKTLQRLGRVHLNKKIKNIGELLALLGGAAGALVGGIIDALKKTNDSANRRFLKANKGDDFYDNLLQMTEHTWGMDTKLYLCDFQNYTNADFEKAKTQDIVDVTLNPPSYQMTTVNTLAAKTKTAYSVIQESWVEQRKYIQGAINALPKAQRPVAEEIVLNKPMLYDNLYSDGEPMSFNTEYTVNGFTFAFDESGGLKYLKDKFGQTLLKMPEGKSTFFEYQVFSADCYRKFSQTYNRNFQENFEWSAADYTKPGLENLRIQPFREECRSCVVVRMEKDLFRAEHIHAIGLYLGAEKVFFHPYDHA